MSRLNGTIKILVLLGNTLFLVLALAVASVSSMIYSGELIALNFDSAKRVAIKILFIAITFIVFTISGCCGAFNQTVREGLCSGRRTLSIHLLILIVICATSTIQVEELKRREVSLNFVINTEDKLKPIDLFESKLGHYFNQAYFEINKESQERFLSQWIDEHCPERLSQFGQGEKSFCDQTCHLRLSEEVWDEEVCCPSREVCFNLQLDKACPYFSCRIAILEEFLSMIHHALVFFRLVSVFSAMMVSLTCLLICYNPRDDIEIELFKTGVMTEEDVRTIRRLKRSSGSNFSYEKGKNVHSINLDQLHQQKEKDESRFSQASRRSATRSTGRIHPVKHTSP